MSLAREPDAEPIPGYKLIEPLGSGGFGEVWKCVAPGGLFKAIKFVYGNLNSQDGDAAAAEQENKALQRIKEVRHPFVLSTERIEIIDGELVIVSELADKSLHDLYVECQSSGLLGIPREQLLSFVRDAAEALDHMFQKHNLQHLDIKPRNLFVISDRVKVADFGLVKTLERQSGSGLMTGVTPLYASPETFNGRISEHSDQYSLAIVYQELLTGQRPFSGKNVRQLAIQHLSEEPEVRSLPEAERPIVARALAKDPAQRFPNCLAFVRGLITARAPITVASPELATAGSRPKTMVDTLEDLLLDQQNADVVPESPKPAEPIDEISQLGITVAQPDTGSLRPTLVIGLGSYGRRALRELRCRFIDHFGDLSRIPLLRFLYVDIDPEEIRQASRGSPEVAFAPAETQHLPLQQPGSYRRRSLDQLMEWMPREKLYTLPRDLTPRGSRALGRLAFADNYLRFQARLRRELHQASHPDSLYQAVTLTGLALRDSVPRVYVIAAAGGGSSGFLVDLGYALRSVLKLVGHPVAHVSLLLHCGAPTDPATPPTELANIYATLTELNHFGDPAVPFSAQYSADGNRVTESAFPYGAIYLLATRDRAPELLRDSVAHLGSYLFHDITTPLGLRLDRSRQAPIPESATRFRSFGTHAVWFPRGLLLRHAARQTLGTLLESWMSTDAALVPSDIPTICTDAWIGAGLLPEAFDENLVTTAGGGIDGGLAGGMNAMLAVLEQESQQSSASENPGTWARHALIRVLEWVGTNPAIESHLSKARFNLADTRKSRLSRALTSALQKLAEEAGKTLSGVANEFMDRPNVPRLAAAEAALLHYQGLCEKAAQSCSQRREQQAVQTEQAWERVDATVATCVAESSGFRLFGRGSSRRALRAFLEQAGVYAQQRLTEDLAAAAQQFFTSLHGILGERRNDISFCLQRLRALKDNLHPLVGALDTIAVAAANMDSTPSQSPLPSPETYWDSIRDSLTVRVVLPQGETDLEVASSRFAESLTEQQWHELDESVQEQVLTPRGGLHAACSGLTDVVRSLTGPLLQAAANYLGTQLPVTDVAQVELAIPTTGADDLANRLHEYLEQARPLVASDNPANEIPFLLFPASAAGKSLSDEVKAVLPEVQALRVPGQADLMFCREQGYLTAEDLRRTFTQARAAYTELATVPHASPHSRFDINDWLPLDP
jgi:serine/threonine protein kinase